MNAASRVIITIMSVLAIAAILVGLYIHVFGNSSFFSASPASSDTVSLEGVLSGPDSDYPDTAGLEGDYADLSVETGDAFSIDYTLPSNPKIEIKNGSLTIKSKVNEFSSFFKMKPDYKIEVVIPEGTELTDFDLNMDAGKVSMEGIKTKKLKMNSDAGDVDLDDIKADTFDINTDAGNIEMNEIETKNLIVNADAGNLKINDSTIDRIDAHIDAGNIEAHDSTINSGSCKTDFGNVSLNGNIGDVKAKSSVGNATIDRD